MRVSKIENVMVSLLNQGNIYQLVATLNGLDEKDLRTIPSLEYDLFFSTLVYNQDIMGGDAMISVLNVFLAITKEYLPISVLNKGEKILNSYEKLMVEKIMM